MKTSNTIPKRDQSNRQHIKYNIHTDTNLDTADRVIREHNLAKLTSTIKSRIITTRAFLSSNKGTNQFRGNRLRDDEFLAINTSANFGPAGFIALKCQNNGAGVIQNQLGKIIAVDKDYPIYFISLTKESDKNQQSIIITPQVTKVELKNETLNPFIYDDVAIAIHDYQIENELIHIIKSERLEKLVLEATPKKKDSGLIRLNASEEDKLLKYFKPKIYKKISKMQKKNRFVNKNTNIHRFASDIEDILNRLDLDVEIIGSRKGAYSIHYKAHAKGKHTLVTYVRDLNRMRIVIDDDDNYKACEQIYRVYGAIIPLFSNKGFNPIIGRDGNLIVHKDFVANPKSNLYQSFNNYFKRAKKPNLDIEVQIMTRRMEHIANLGSANDYHKRSIADYAKVLDAKESDIIRFINNSL